jgi:hypothetical protein
MSWHLFTNPLSPFKGRAGQPGIQRQQELIHIPDPKGNSGEKLEENAREDQREAIGTLLYWSCSEVTAQVLWKGSFLL